MNKSWKYKKIGDVCIVERGGSPRPIDKFITEDSKGINWIKIGDTTESMYITETAQKIIPEGMKKSRYVEPGDFLLSNSMSFGRPYILKIDGCIHDGWLVLRDKDNIFDKRFLYYYLSSKATYEKFKQMAVGGVVNNLNSEMVRGVSVPVISKNEQEEIANILDKVSEVAILRKKELEELDNLIKSRFVEMFGDTIHNDRGWKTDTVEKLCKEIYGGGTPSKARPEYYENGNIPWVSSKDMKTDILSDSQIKINQLGVDNSTARMVPVNSVIMVIRSGILKHTLPVAINAVPITVNQDLKVFIPGERILTRFLAIQFKMHEKDILSGVRAVTADNIEFNSLKQRELIVPPIELQQEYVAFLEQVDKLKFVKRIEEYCLIVFLQRRSLEMQEKLLIKAKEAFVMAIEIYNKPTIKYRVEGFSFFICNAWELMLKSYMIKKYGEDSIYYRDNPERTITLENCLQKVVSNEKAPLRKNLSKIIELRNTSTHFVTEEYEMIYIPLFQACVLNFVEKMQEYHNVDMTEVIPQNFLTLAVSMKSLDESVIRAKYPEEIAEKMIQTNQQLQPMIAENNQAFAIKIEHLHFITKDKSKATSFVHVDKDAETGVKIIKELKDPNNTHKYTMKNAIKEINRRLQSMGIEFVMNQYIFDLFNKKYGIKENEKYCYVHRQYAQPSYTYSIQAIELIVAEISKDPGNIISYLKKAKK